MNQIEFAVQWLEQKHKTLQVVSHETDDLNSEYLRGFNQGIKFAVKSYEEEIKQIRQLLNGYMVEDVNLNGGEEHVSA